MKSGSRITLTIMPAIIMPLATRESPAAIKRSLPTIESEAVAQPKYQMFIYFFTSASASPCAPKHSNVPLIVTMPSTASTTEKRNTSTSPEVASRAARPCRPPPSACAAVVMTPMPSP